MNKQSEANNRELVLIQQVFGTPAGAELLKMWTRYHVMSGIAHENPAVLNQRVGKAEFVITILNCLEGG